MFSFKNLELQVAKTVFLNTEKRGNWQFFKQVIGR